MGGDPIPGLFTKMVEAFEVWKKEFEEAHPVDPRVARILRMRARALRHQHEKEKIRLKAKRISPILVLVIAGVLIGGGVLAYIQFWQSDTFSISVSVSAVLDVFCNLENPMDLGRVEEDTYPWVYTALTTTTNWIEGDMIRIMANYETTTIANDDVYLKVLASGSFITAGGKASVSIQKMYAHWDTTSHKLDSVTAVGGPVAVSDVSTMAPFQLTGLTGSSVLHEHYYYEITISYNSKPSEWGSYDLNIVLDLNDGA